LSQTIFYSTALLITKTNSAIPYILSDIWEF